MNIDLDKVSKALQGLSSDQGSRVVGELHQQLEQFRKQLGTDLNDAEFRHVMQTLFAQQTVSAPQGVSMENVGGGFQIRRAVAGGGQDVI